MAKEQKRDTQCYRLVEMEESMNQSIDSAKRVLEQQNKLKEVLEKCEYAEEFESFLGDLDKNQKAMKNQIAELEARVEKLNVVNEAIQKSETFDKLVDALIFAIGMFK